MNTKDAQEFAKLIGNVRFENIIIRLGNSELKGVKGVKSSIQYNRNNEINLLSNNHEYTFKLKEGNLELSLQLYLNTNNHYRLFCFTKINGITGLLFSVNLTTEKDSKGIIFLNQKIKFSEREENNIQLTQEDRKLKQHKLSQLLKKMGFEVTENNDIILGIFDTKLKELKNTKSNKFISDFITVSLLKGHFMGNKGYKLNLELNKIENNEQLNPNIESNKLLKYKASRNVPLAMRYSVLRNDRFKCVACGRSPKDNITLQIDHKEPFSIGGLTTMDNLQTLCNECNLGKSNNYIDY